MSEAAAHAWEVYRSADCLYSATQVQAAVRRLALEATGALRSADPVLLCPMTGGVVLAGQLLPLLEFPLEFDYIHATRYRGATTGGAIEWRARPVTALAGRQVLIVDDVLDHGVTLQALLAHCLEAGAAKVLTMVLVAKDLPRASGIAADFIGLHAPDRYLFGYGMDYHGYLRNAPGIYAVRDT